MKLRTILPLAAAIGVAACSPSADDNPPPAKAALPASEDARLESFLIQQFVADAPVSYRAGRVDLDGDGTDEVLAYVGGPMVCGSGGCPLLVLKDDGKDFKVLTQTSVTQLPVGVLDSRTNGMRDLWVTIGGGGAEGGTVKLAWDGKSYPTNPTVDPATKIAKPGIEVIGKGDLRKLSTS
ncbi:hypothetical protein [Tsuneonella mangrovi]|uniref:hypothetical protein n=1 Tax=Tsuneonella mangrovi TaxID=1982042 RepID=UPI000BA2A57E|nr:hypothetical protein [Tsuneonella mangrovi]